MIEVSARRFRKDLKKYLDLLEAGEPVKVRQITLVSNGTILVDKPKPVEVIEEPIQEQPESIQEEFQERYACDEEIVENCAFCDGKAEYMEWDVDAAENRGTCIECLKSKLGKYWESYAKRMKKI